MMELLRSQMEFALRPENKDFQWPDATEDLFDSFINPDSFHHVAPNTTGSDQREYSNDFIGFFDTYASSSGSDSLDVPTIPDSDHHTTWHGQFSALSFEQQDEALHERFGTHLSIYFNSNGRAACSHTDLIVLPTDDVENDCVYTNTAPSTSRWRTRTRTRRSLDTPLSIRKRQTSGSPSKIEKTQRRETTMRRNSPHKASHSGAQLTKRFQDAAATAQLDNNIPMSSYRLATPPPSTQLRAGSFDWEFNEDQAVRSPSPFDEEFDLDHPMSPASSNGYSQLQHHNNTPAHTPGEVASAESLKSPHVHSHTEPHDHLPSYSSPPLDPHPEDFSPTPPATEPMNHAPWSQPPDQDLAFMHHGLASPRPAGKAEQHWSFTGGVVDPTHVRCGAPASAAAASNGDFGLGISCSDNQDEHGMDFGAYEPQDRRQGPQHHHSLMQQGSNVARRPLSAEFGASALSLSPQQSMFSMSLLMDQGHHDHHGMSYSLSTPSQQQAVPSFSPTPAQMQTRQTYRPSHQRSHTIGGPITSFPSSMLTQPAYASLYFPSPIQSPSPPPTHQAHTSTHCSVYTSPSHRQRSKSAHHARRKSTSATSSHTHQRQSSASAANVGFVNFTPQDSKKILTGVAPSGSSKTKARREREAAEKRRKLGEAAKKAILDAGGDLQALEREVLALGGGED